MTAASANPQVSQGYPQTLPEVWARYRGLPKIRVQHAFSATALNIVRLDAWWTTDPLRHPRTSRLERLNYQLVG